ncbi:four-helix bundle copper-binding protein [Limnoglobus roseus]|uniref:Four-helix bundle copper-binding protein n=1 Tax=Limnoglobus roseus TaxID=2598579 RepID=A0A5C1ALF7_9BACT|nr:four-helix bundle copper-binding protein [Limnoglobus roseus]QEL18024.1 four-helix bundle copper-binding protein [Limnoglobus roseus]
MTTRKMGGIGLTVCVLAFVVMAGFARFGQSEDNKPPATAAHPHDDAMMTCAKACSDCQRACDSCAAHCGHKLHEGMKEHHASLVSCQDCATVCAAASQIVARSGPYSMAICTACADVCGKCAVECEKFPNDAHMKACAEECRKCEKACQAMAKHH